MVTELTVGQGTGENVSQTKVWYLDTAFVFFSLCATEFSEKVQVEEGKEREGLRRRERKKSSSVAVCSRLCDVLGSDAWDGLWKREIREGAAGRTRQHGREDKLSGRIGKSSWKFGAV